MTLGKYYLLLVFMGLISCQAQQQKQNEHSEDKTEMERYRPLFHFTPEKNWTNDPNGLVYLDGEYHLFYQYNPYGDRWGHMSWGHAVTKDLLNWEHLPVALYEEDSIMIFSGSAIVDNNNTSGLCSDNKCLFAVYTSHDHSQNKLQHQSIAYSKDKGRTWTKYSGNPVLDLGMRDFRDPKVFWHEESGKWIMVVSLPLQYKVHFYQSENLTDWELTGEFGGFGDVSKIWECPDLLQIPVIGSDDHKWVLIISSGSQYEGFTGMQYFVGEFDGETFIADDPGEDAEWLDYGKDFYAAITYNNLPDGHPPVLLGWANNWAYANSLPTSPWRGMMSLPRELYLVEQGDSFMLIQKPVKSFYELTGRSERIAFADHELEDNDNLLNEINSGSFLMKIEFEDIETDMVGIEIFKSDVGKTLIGYDAQKKQIFIDRTQSGNVDFHNDFSSIEFAPMILEDNKLRLEIIADQSMVEVFAEGGSVVISDQVFPESDENGMQLVVKNGKAKAREIEIYQIQ
jgi:fructan beta-fructosidase